MSHVRRLLGFAFVPGLTMVSTILLLPLISSKFGPAGWSAVGLGQSLGAFLGVIAGLAWHVVGAQQVAVSTPEERRVLYAESVKSRALVLLIATPLAGALCYALAPAYKWECVAFMVATGLNCLNASWFFAGTGQPKYVIRNEASIRLVGYVVAIPALAVTDSMWAYAAILIAVGVLMALANIFSIFNLFSSETWAQTRKTRTIVKEHVHGMVARGFSAGQQYLGITVVSLIMPQSLPIYSALDNMQKTANNATAFFPQAFAWWVGSPQSVESRYPRVRKMVSVILLIGVLVFVGWMVAGPLIMDLLYHGKAEASFWLHFWTACGMAAFTMSRSLEQLCLVPLGLPAMVYRGTTVCAVVGLPGIAVGLWFGGVAGALSATGITYAGLCVFYLFVTFAGLRGRYPQPLLRYVWRPFSERGRA